jgi:hypothetical protein
MRNQILAAGPFEDFGGNQTGFNADVFIPTDSPNGFGQSVLNSLPGIASQILGILTPKPQPQTNYTPFLLLGGAALLIFALKK